MDRDNEIRLSESYIDYYRQYMGFIRSSPPPPSPKFKVTIYLKKNKPVRMLTPKPYTCIFLFLVSMGINYGM